MICTTTLPWLPDDPEAFGYACAEILGKAVTCDGKVVGKVMAASMDKTVTMMINDEHADLFLKNVNTSIEIITDEEI